MKGTGYSIGDLYFSVQHFKRIRKNPAIYYYNPEKNWFETAASFKSEEMAEKFVGWLDKLAHAKVIEEEGRDVG